MQLNNVINSRRPVRIPRGFKNEELLNESTSPNGTYTINN
ncbi:DUF5412 domain-containing protein [Clostridium gasigenes]|nr:DUF5412 domain-containing protein [Clostridium gasigenes]